MGDLLGQNGRHAEAETLLQDALARFRNRLGPEHPDVALTLMDLGRLLHTLDRDSEARPLLTEALDMNRRLLGPDHPRTQYSENLLNEAMQTSD